MSSALFIRNAISESRGYKGVAEGAIAQIPDAALFEALDEESNSIAMLIKHLSGNLLSRWSDFKVSDGDKATRDRESEFRSHPADTKENLMERWEAGWSCLFSALEKAPAGGPRKDGHDPRRALHGIGGDATRHDAPGVPRRADRAAREALPRERLSVAEHPAREVGRVSRRSPPGRTAVLETVKLQNRLYPFRCCCIHA